MPTGDKQVLAAPAGPSTDKPSNPTKGQLFFNATSGNLEVWDGSAWDSLGGGSGTSDHAALSNLPWTSSGHTGTATRVAVFDGSGNAAYSTYANVVVTGGGLLNGDTAGGDLSGTYPNPVVDVARGLRETSGPTELVMDDVATGEVLARSGSTIVGRSANQLVFPVLRELATGSTRNRWYPMAGWTGVTMGSGGNAAGGRLRAFPVIFAAGHVIEQVAINVIVAVAASAVRVGLYENVASDCYPGDLIVDFGAFTTSTTGVKTITGLSQSVNSDVLLWVAIWQSHNTSLRGLVGGSQFPILGASSSLGTDNGIAWESTQTYTVGTSTLSDHDPFPTGASVLETGGTYPMYFSRFSS